MHFLKKDIMYDLLPGLIIHHPLKLITLLIRCDTKLVHYTGETIYQDVTLQKQVFISNGKDIWKDFLKKILLTETSCAVDLKWVHIGVNGLTGIHHDWNSPTLSHMNVYQNIYNCNQFFSFSRFSRLPNGQVQFLRWKDNCNDIYFIWAAAMYISFTTWESPVGWRQQNAWIQLQNQCLSQTLNLQNKS